ncbi:MAG: hypothetical protein OXC44_06620 [Proteobacteria bacterium]|nr:hypothetical protein [Pseudomonadota bacterium]
MQQIPSTHRLPHVTAQVNFSQATAAASSQASQDLLQLDKAEAQRGKNLQVLDRPTLICNENRAYFDGRVMNLRKKRTLERKLFQLFSHTHTPIAKDHVIEHLYEVSLEEASPRRRQCMNNALNKLMVRTRGECKKHLDQPGNPQWEWFVFDHQRKCYSLVEPHKTRS